MRTGGAGGWVDETDFCSLRGDGSVDRGKPLTRARGVNFKVIERGATERSLGGVWTLDGPAVVAGERGTRNPVDAG